MLFALLPPTKEPRTIGLRPRFALFTAGMISRLAALVALLAALAVVPLATGVEVELPESPTTTLDPGDRPAEPGVEPEAIAPATTKKLMPLKPLRMGARGDYVRDLQRELRKRGIRVKVDGVFGGGTRRGVKIVQKRLKIRSSGVATTGLQRRLGIRPRKTTVAISTPVEGGGAFAVFPVARKYSYGNDFGAPRHQGAHQGIDIIAPRGTPVYAVNDGVVDRLARAERGLGGLYVWQRGNGSDRSTEYYYAHLDSVAPGLEEGTPVTAGQIIGAVGNTGDARYGLHHLHFEYRPFGRSVSPYPHLVASDPNKRPRASTRRS